MTWQDVGNFLGKSAPVIGSLLGPAGIAVGGLISAALGTANTPDAVMTELQNNPDAIVKVQQIEATKQVDLAKIANEQIASYLNDIQDARKRQVESEKVTGKKDWNLYLLAWTIVMSFFIVCGILIFVPLPAGQANIVYMLLGTLGTGFVTVISYFFGSSKGSADKTQILAGKQ